MSMKKVTVLVEKSEWWYAEIEVPEHMTEDEIYGFIADDEDASRVWDEDLHECKAEWDVTIVKVEPAKEVAQCSS